MDIEKLKNEQQTLLDLQELERETERLLQEVKGKTAKKKSKTSSGSKAGTEGKAGRDGNKKSSKSTPNQSNTGIRKIEGDKHDKKASHANRMQPPMNKLMIGDTSSYELLDDDAPDRTPRYDDDDDHDESFQIGSKNMNTPSHINNRQDEVTQHKLRFDAEQHRIALGGDTFLPHPSLTTADVEKEKVRLQRIEDSYHKSTSSNIMISSSNLSPTTKPSSSFSIDDFYAVKIQSSFRGYVGRKKAILCQKIQEMISNNDHQDEINNDSEWVEVRDRASGDIWYYHKGLGISQWERPQEMKATLNHAMNASLQVLPISSSNQSASNLQHYDDADDEKMMTKKRIAKKLPSSKKSSSSILRPVKLKSIQRPGYYSEYDIQAQRELENLMGIDKILSTEKLISPDGHFKPQLRTTVLDALLESKFDSVATVIADGAWLNKDDDDDNDHRDDGYKKDRNQADVMISRPINRLNKPMVSVMKIHDKKSKKNIHELNIEPSSSNKIKKLSELTVRDISHPGFIANASDITTNQFNTHDIDHHTNNMTTKQPNNICFACWSSGNNRSCSLHALSNNDPISSSSKLKPSESMLLCRNWDLAVMQRRYRSEEIQEIFMKRSQSLRYDVRRKKFSTTEEYRHIIYRLLHHDINTCNRHKHLYNSVKRWMMSLKDVVSSSSGIISHETGLLIIPAHVEKMRAKRTRSNTNFIRLTCQDVRAMIPLPPTTGYSYAEKQGFEKYLYTLHDSATGRDVELIVIKPLPSSSRLYVPREYQLPIPRSIPLPTPSYDDDDHHGTVNRYIHPLPLNQFIDDRMSYSWIERLSSKIARDAISSSLAHIISFTPMSSLHDLHHAKISSPATVKFAMIGRKPTPDMMAIGGLPVELLAYQLVTTYYPPQYGSLVIIDKSAINPGITPELMIVFDSWTMPPGRQVYVYRPVEHPLNYRKSPTIGIYSSPDDAMIDNRHYYGLNRPEQTGEQDHHGFRTSSYIKHLHIYQETDPLSFSPGSDIVSFNVPGANKSYTTHADLTYPFCEPSTRDNSTLDFYHLLLSSIYSYAKPQIFTSLSVQEAGSFLKESKDILPLGHLVVSTYRSWAFVQKDIIEEFHTDDGVSYWYHRRTGQTFWQRPLYDDENISPMLGGTVIDDQHQEEPTISRQAVDGGVNRRYLQGDVRKSILSHHETDKEAVRRRWNVSYAAEKARDRGLFQPHQHQNDMMISSMDGGDAEIARLIHQRQDNAVMNAVMAGSGLKSNIRQDFSIHKNITMMDHTSGMLELEINSQKNKTSTIPDNTFIFDHNHSMMMTDNSMMMMNQTSTSLSSLNNDMISPTSSASSMMMGNKRDLTIQTSGLHTSTHEMMTSKINTNAHQHHQQQHQQQNAGVPFTPGVLSSITDSISQMLSHIDTANPQDMIQLGLGMGMAIMSSAAVQSVTETAMTRNQQQHHQQQSYHNHPASGLSSHTGFDSFASPHSIVTATTVTTASGHHHHSNNNMMSPMNHTTTTATTITGAGGFKSPTKYDNNFTPSLPQIREENTSSKPHQHQNHMNSSISLVGTSEPIGLPHPTISTSVNKNLDHDEESQQRHQTMKQLTKPLTTMEKARKLTIAPNDQVTSATPDIASSNNEYLDYPRNADERIRENVPILMYPELATTAKNLPPEAMTHPSATTHDHRDHDILVDPNSRIKVQKHVLPLPNGFHQAIFSSHVAKQEADYLPQVPNLPQTRTVGRVKPRSAALDWIAISFDPWSAGKQPVNSEYVSSLTANANKFFDNNDPRGAVDAIEMMRHDTIADAFTNVEDVEGQMQQRAEISRAQIMAQDFKKICSLCRHNKFSEVEQLINQPDWTLPIDYQDDQGNTLLHIAAQNGNKRMIKIFMRRGITLDTQNLQGQTSLHYLYGYGYADVGEYLVKKGANDSIKNKDGLTCYEGLGARELSLL